MVLVANSSSLLTSSDASTIPRVSKGSPCERPILLDIPMPKYVPVHDSISPATCALTISGSFSAAAIKTFPSLHIYGTSFEIMRSISSPMSVSFATNISELFLKLTSPSPLRILALSLSVESGTLCSVLIFFSICVMLSCLFCDISSRISLWFAFRALSKTSLSFSLLMQLDIGGSSSHFL